MRKNRCKTRKKMRFNCGALCHLPHTWVIARIKQRIKCIHTTHTLHTSIEKYGRDFCLHDMSMSMSISFLSLSPSLIHCSSLSKWNGMTASVTSVYACDQLHIDPFIFMGDWHFNASFAKTNTLGLSHTLSLSLAFVHAHFLCMYSKNVLIWSFHLFISFWGKKLQ